MLKNYKKSLINLGLLLVSISLMLVMLEFSARIIWSKKYNDWLGKQLHGFEKVDENRSVIVPIANTKVTVNKLRGDLIKHGKTIGLKILEKEIKKRELKGEDVVIKINNYGFRGSDILVPKPNSIYRILAIGDSCTWGPLNDSYTYPRVMEQELNKPDNKNYRLEVVNAGVMGYNFERVLKRIDDFLIIDPDLITIYLGWNRTIERADPKKNNLLYRNLAIYKIYYHLILNRKDTGLEENYNTRTYFDKDDSSLKSYENYNFNYDIADLNKLVNKITQKRKNTHIMIITLAGLFDYRLKPDEISLEIAYPITSSNNLYAYPLLTKKYNDELRRYAKNKRIELIDFEQFAFNNFKIRSKYFNDSVHLNEKGYFKMGKYFASKINIVIKPKNQNGHF